MAAVALFATATMASATGAWEQKVDAAVLEAAANGETGFFVYLEPKANLQGAELELTKADKTRHVYEQLTATARATQAPVVEALDRTGASHRSFWITNAVAATGGLDALEAVASLPDVEHVYAIGTGRLDPPVDADVPGGTTSLSATTAVFDSTALVKANQAWSLGYRGQGAVVASADTGVRWTHEAIKTKYRGWDGTAGAHDYNWHDSIHNPNAFCAPDSPQPCDDDAALGRGHGTHTVGTMLGEGPDVAGQKNQFGMAPDAKWIACRNMNNGLGTIPMYFECMQWFLAPTKVDGTAPDPSKAPDVVNNSWGCVEACPPPALQDALRASRAAGIFYAVSAGNDGVGGPGPAAGCSTIYHPLARYPEAFTVGSTTWTTDTISSFSSRGPTVLGDPPGTLLLTKPNITAPGSSIRSALAYASTAGAGSDTAYGSLSGTSMAGPHVAGLVALIISANPALAGNVDAIEDIIEQTAVRKTTTEGCGLDSPTQVPNNTYGWGRIDALAAVQSAIAQRPDLRVTHLTFSETGNKQARVTATVSNAGATPAGVSKTELVLDGSTVLGLVDTSALAPGATATVSVTWSTHHVRNGVHQITATADKTGLVAESDETNNVRTIEATIRGNKVRNGSFEQDADGNGSPDGWTGTSTGAGSTSWSDGGSDGSKSASTTGSGGSAIAQGSPRWTSDPIAVTPGTVLDFQVSALGGGTSSPATAGLTYLGPAGNALGTVTLVTSPLTTAGFGTLSRSVAIPAGVAQVRVVLTGFAPTDLATAGTTRFDDVGLYEN